MIKIGKVNAANELQAIDAMAKAGLLQPSDVSPALFRKIRG